MKLILIAAIGLSLASCSTFRKAVDGANSNEAFVGPVVTLVSTAIFEKAVSPEDRTEKALVVHKLAEKIAEIKFDKKPAKAEFAALIAAQLPDKSHWLVLASSLSEVYEKYTKNLTDEDVEKTLTVIHNIAEALALSTQRYL